ncbi:MAG: DUF262 domain-containing protein [Deltaproteobacteria bacterium]|nr:DUF262 domain-containing protein [Deltaproteobacteria bacterium]
MTPENDSFRTVESALDLACQVKKGKLSLPTIQRGFVWRPHQIELFWDSILRGYPVGVFIGGDIAGGGQLEILDGQQRLTALALAFDDRSEEFPAESDQDRVMNANYRNWQLFIDLLKPAGADDSSQTPDNRQFIFRVITKSQPWGYDLRNNWERLRSGRIHAALEAYRADGLLSPDGQYYHKDLDLRRFYPFSAVAPVPFRFFLRHVRETNIPELKANIRRWLGNFKALKDAPDADRIPEIWMGRFPEQREWPSYQERFHGKGVIKPRFYTLEEIAEAVKAKLNTPSMVIFTPSVLAKDQDVNDNNIENMFVRVNTGGTTITNEELNYSLTKRYIDRETIEKIENKCKSRMFPARFIAISYRLFKVWMDETRRATLDLGISPRQFARELNESLAGQTRLEHFKKFLEQHFLGEGSLLDEYEDLLKYSPDNPNGWPQPLFPSLAGRAPQLVFLLWYRRLEEEKDQPIDKERILSVLTTLFFFPSWGNYQNTLRHIWPIAVSGKYPASRFWGQEIMERALCLENENNENGDKDAPRPPLPKPEDIDGNEDYLNRRVFANNNVSHNFLLYAQRRYLDKWFPKELFELDDVNTPYDFDHILPHSFISYRSGLKPEFKSLYNGIGNLRAWPYELNRSDQDNGLGPKFNPLGIEGATREEEHDFWRNSPYFKEYIEEHKSDDIPVSLRKVLLAASLCDDDSFWTGDGIEINPDNINNNIEKIEKAIKNRRNRLYINFYNDLKINNFSPNDILSDFSTFFKRYFSLAQEIKKEKDGSLASLLVGDRFYLRQPADWKPYWGDRNIEISFEARELRKVEKPSDNGNPNLNAWHQKNIDKYFILCTLASVSDKAAMDFFAEVALEMERVYHDLSKVFLETLTDDAKAKTVALMGALKSQPPL